MHRCPKSCQSHGIFGKTNALDNILCFQTKFKCGPYSNSAIQLPIQPSELIKKHAHKCPIPGASHVHEKMLQMQSTSQWRSHTHVSTRKACQTMRIINNSLSHASMCKLMPWNIVKLIHGQLAQCNLPLPLPMPFPTLKPSFLPPWHAFLWITSVHPSQITSQVAFTSAPFWRRISATSLCPWNADVYKGLRPSWGINHGQQTNAWQYPFIALLFNIEENANTTLTASEYNTFTSLLQETCSFYWHNTFTHKCPQKCQSHGMFGKCNALNNILCFQRKFNCSPYSNSAIKFSIQCSELIKKHAHRCPSLV